MTGDGALAHGVIVVVDYHSHLPSAVDVAIALAHTRRLALRGLFLEDPDLASVSSLPFSQEVTLAGARPRAFEEERLRRTLQVLAREGAGEGIPADEVAEILSLAKRAHRSALSAAHLEDLRAVLSSWRYLHRWVAALMVALVLVHVGYALFYSDSFFGGGSR